MERATNATEEGIAWEGGHTRFTQHLAWRLSDEGPHFLLRWVFGASFLFMNSKAREVNIQVQENDLELAELRLSLSPLPFSSSF